MQNLDYLVFYSYLLVIIVIGVMMRRKQTTENEFFLAGRSLGWFPLGISIMVTMLTAVNFGAFPNEIFKNGCYVLVCLPIFFVVAFPIIKYFIPFFQKQKGSSAYAFLEETFDTKTRCLGSILFMFWRVVWMAVALYASGKFLSTVTGYKLEWLILVCGLITVTYTAFGGLRVVIWTDVAQFFVLFGGIVFALILVSGLTESGFFGIFTNAYEHGVFRPAVPFDPEFFSFDPRVRTTLWSGAIGSLVAFLARYGSDQMVIQRYCAANSLEDARKGFLFNIFCMLFILTLLFIFGMAIHSYAVHTGILGKYKEPMAYMAQLIKSLPFGATGLLAAGLLAATMSSVDSGINACSMTWTKDFYHRFWRKSEVSEKQHIRYGVFFSVTIGILIILFAELMTVIFREDRSIFVIFNKVINSFGSPLLVLVILGMKKRRPNSNSVFWGVLSGALVSIACSLFIKELALHYYAVLNLAATFLLVYLINLLKVNK